MGECANESLPVVPPDGAPVVHLGMARAPHPGAFLEYNREG